MWSYKVGVVSLLVPEVLAQVNGPCEDAVAAACPGLSGDECNTCGLANEATISPSCTHFPHDMTEACGATPSPTPSPEPTPTPSPPPPTPTPSPPTPTPTPSPPTPTPTPSPSPPGTNTINPTTDNCDDLDSCSPTSFCSKVSNEACSFPEPTIDIAGEIESLGCRQCTQASVSEHPICSADALKSTLVTPSGIQAAFCNDKYLVIHANGMPNHETHLDLVPRPPGGGGGGSYDDQCVTRSFVHQFQTFKIPLEYSLLADGKSNTVYGKLPDMDLPQSGAIGVTINGIPLYPNEDNRGETVQQACESDKCMAHVGMGADYHYHGDPFGSSCLYNEESYTGSHPAIIGWGSDGPTIYGRYTSKSQDGTDVALDDCGGHAHGSLPYHYHPNVVQKSSSSDSDATFEAFSVSPLNCWKGDISGVENFWEGTHQINYDNSFTSPPYTPSKRSDAQQIQPCCSSTEYYTASGISLPLSADEMFA